MFVESMLQSTVVSLIPYVTSHFNEHSLTGYTFIMSSIVGGVLKLPLAKLLDIWGRPQGFMLMVGIMVLGLVMMAACNTVHIFAAAEVFHWVG